MTGVRVVSPETVRHTNGISNLTRSDEMYINSAMQTSLISGTRSNGSATPNTGSQDPLSPSDHHDIEHTHRGRRMRSPLLPPDSPPAHIPVLPPRLHRNPGVHPHSTARAPRPRDFSPSKMALLPPSSSSSPRSGSVPPSILPATVPPPVSLAFYLSSHTVSTPSFDSIPPPPITTTTPPFPSPHNPPSPPPHPHPLATTSDTNKSSSDKRNHSTYIISSKTGNRITTRPYDHLVESENEGAIPHLVRRPVSDTDSRDSKYIYTYVPTEEQRRLVQLQNTGRYEVTEEFAEVSPSTIFF